MIGDFLNNLGGLLEGTKQISDAESCYRQALVILETSLGRYHPKVAIPLNNLARLLQANNRFLEAEPLMRRHLVIFIDFERKTGYPHPHRDAGQRNYAGLLAAMGKSEAEIKATIASLAAEGCARGPQ